MKKVLLLLLHFIPAVLFAQQRYNLDIEKTDSITGLPADWMGFKARSADGCSALPDSAAVYSGKYAILLPEENVAAHTDEQNWLKAHAMPLKTVDAGHGTGDLQGLKPLIGDARIVALGECTHGSSEVFRMKHRLLEFLVTEMGFRIFAIEANLPETNVMNDYVLYGKGSADKGLDAMYFWTWNTKEVLEMAKWMRAYNVAHPDKMVQFVGFDMQFSRGACDNLSQFAMQHAPELKPVMDSVILYCNKYMRIAYNNPILREDNARLAGWLNEVGDLLKKNRKQYAQLAGDSVLAWQTRYLVVLQQYLKMRSEVRSGRNIRDESMAENVAWIAAQYPDQKLVLWAHDGHVGRRSASMGGHLDKTFKKDMVIFGFGTAKGQYTAMTKGKGLQADNSLCAPIPRSFERYAQATGIGNFILDIRKENLQDEGASWLLRSARLRSIGALALDHCNTQFEGGILPDVYDAIIYLENTTASKMNIHQ